MEKEGISLICACKNRTEALKVSLASWACFKQIKEIKMKLIQLYITLKQ
jgi:hypothetical protein